MESSGGSERAHGPQLEKKRLNRAPSPARPFIKDVHSRSTKSSLVPKSPKLTKQSPAVPLAHPSRNSRRTATAAKDKPPAAKTAPRTPAKKSPKACPKPEPTSPVLLAVQKVKHAHGSPIRVPTGADNVRVAAAAGSSSDLSDCSAPESGTGSSDRDNPQARAPAAGTGASVALRAEPPGARSMPQPQPNKVPVAPKEAPEEELLREIEDLRSENDYLKDEVDELRAEMEEIRDNYLEEEVYQVQELRRELDRSNKNCRILQYRLRKAEQKSLRVAQTGHVDGELLRTLEQDLKVAKDVSVRLHNELEAVEEKRSRAEDENEALRQKIIEVEISKQALTNELDRTKEMAQRRRGGRDSFKDKKSTNQEDSADLRCQLQFVKEESSLMRKKMAKLSREKDELEQELQKYKSVYGDVDSPLPLAECSGGGPHSTREAELRLRLKLVEEEANILGRKIVELEVENRSLRSENEDIRCQYERDCFGREPFSSMPSSPYGGDALESASELRRHLQFVEEEAELLRRSISEIEDHNRQLTSELNRFKFGPSGSSTIGEESSEAGLFKSGNGSSLIMEELKSARIQINELSGKVMKLQYENRVLLSNVQRYDLAANTGTRTASPRDSDADQAAEEEEANRLMLLQPKREGPIGGESDSDDLFEKTGTTSGFGSIKPSDGSELSAIELANRRREERESFNNVKREADRLGKTVDRLITDTDSLVYEGRLVVTTGEATDASSSSTSKPDTQVLDTINTRMKAFRTELHIFMERLEHVGEAFRDRTDDLSPMPNLTESSSFLSTVTSMSRDSPIATFGRDLGTDFQIRDSSVSEVHFRLDPERRLKSSSEEATLCLTQEDERLRAEAQRGGLQLPGLQTHDSGWPQERAALHQELRLFRRNTIILYMKLRATLAQWRSRHREEPAEGATQPELERLEGIPELSVEQAETERDDRLSLAHSSGDVTETAPPISLPSPDRHLQHQRQFGENKRLLLALRCLLEEFREELREEERRRGQLQQSFASEKAEWAVRETAMKSQITQLKGEEREADADTDQAFKQEREEHKRLLSESHSATLDLRWKLQHGEKRWSREKSELMDQFERERQEWDSSMREMHRKMDRLQRELTSRQAEGAESTPLRASSPPQDSPSVAPISSAPAPPPAPMPTTRSHSDSDTVLEEQRVKGPSDNPFVDALTLDPLSLDVPSSGLESEKRFPCMKEALNELSEREGESYPDDEMGGGSLLRAKSVCSMSDFQRLMDSSPFLPDKDRHSDRGPDDVTPPLSPDDLKYIEEFNSKGWDFPSALASSASAAPNYPREAWSERGSESHGNEGLLDPYTPPSWFLTTSATLTTSTMSSPEHCHRTQLRGHGAGAVGVEHYGYLHSPTRASQGNGRGSNLGDDVFSAGRWQCSGLRTPPNQSICPPVGFPSPLELQLSRNLSDDMKEVAISVRNAIRSPPGPILRDMSCQTNGFTTRGTQTTQTISVGLQTDLLRNLTSSPHRCLTPKGGGTPISSPSRNTRKVQYSPVIQSKFERPCCSPKYGSPKLQRKPSSSSKTDIANSSTRAPTPTTPQKGNSESAWARSTTTRDSPVHTTINDGLSSLFNIIDHTPVSFDPMQKFNKSPSRSRPSEPSPVHEHRTQQDTSRTTRGRSPSPVQLIVETHGDRNSEVVSIRQDLSAPPGYTLAENAARIVSKKLQESCREERRLQGGQSGQRDSGNRMSDSDRQPGCMEIESTD
ncbi:microtubule cross-linking factor 1 isoform X2 [Periophthalmus magnuspinnatus]|uniref:microtubule cross-linking factor 1 isoform X2 n=1 Tax=Periophthalmus magnuspinnatus TaxID=409849 RepID=UPI00145B1F03|nr:microtubule cross-linking factor 1 isoform X2 [Periophthalmus magnuspinnatus]